MRRGAKGFVTCLATLAALGGCSSEADQQRDALAKVMSVPVAKLCPVPESGDNKEGSGVCQGDCRKAVNVGYLRDILSAATELEKLAPSPDPTTERELVPVRAAAHAYAAEVGAACPIDFDRHKTMISEVEDCAAIAKTPPVTAREADFRKALATFLAAMPKGHGFAKASRCGAAP